MALSFITLAYTGFALKFPNEWWFAPLSWAGAEETTRRLIHRIAAVAMVGICLFHIVYLISTARGRGQLKAMLPRLQDVRDFKQMVRYYLGASHQSPAFARFSYAEKVEYWALVWGSVVMTVTGFALWFDNISLQFMPKWMLDAATVVHYYEAWLATLAIIIWHFYFVIFNPRVYPMSLVWLTGRMSEEEMAHEHPLELDQIKQREAAGENRDS
jgi:cytochrome b subunit of formate dehydrogenase